MIFDRQMEFLEEWITESEKLGSFCSYTTEVLTTQLMPNDDSVAKKAYHNKTPSLSQGLHYRLVKENETAVIKVNGGQVAVPTQPTLFKNLKPSSEQVTMYYVDEFGEIIKDKFTAHDTKDIINLRPPYRGYFKTYEQAKAWVEFQENF